MKIKKIAVLLLTLCIMSAAVPAVNAATVIKNIALTGDITPSVDTKLKFASAKESSDYMLFQMWYELDTERFFTDNDTLNGMIDEENFLPENERCFKSGTTYMYTIAVKPNSDTVTFDPSFTISVGEYKELIKESADGALNYAIYFNQEGNHLHISSVGYKSDSECHWIGCTSSDDYAFYKTKKKHDVTVKDGTCADCGYEVADSLITKITKQPESKSINCGDTVEFSVAATGAGLEYIWYGDDNNIITDNDNYLLTGAKVSGAKTSTLKIENFNCNIKKTNNIYCKVVGLRGTVQTDTAAVTVTPKASAYVPISMYKHKCICNCEKDMGDEDHSYSANKCTLCGFVQGSSFTTFKNGVLEIPNFITGFSVEDALKGMTLTGNGIKAGGGIDKTKVKFRKWHPSNSLQENLKSNDVFEKDGTYIVDICLLTEDNVILPENVTITCDGKNSAALTCINNEGKYYLAGVLIGTPGEGTEMTFDAGGGTGTQESVYADLDKDIYFPECTFTKTDDEFFAWRYNDVLYYPDPKKEIPVKITDGAVATAVWKSQLIKDVTVKMDGIDNGDSVSDIAFSVPETAGYAVTGTTWYKGDTVSNINKLSDTDILSTDSDYTVNVVLKGDGFAANDDMNISLNGKRMTDIKRRGAQVMTFTVHIINNIGVTLDAPTDGNVLAKYSDITAVGDKFSVSADTYWSAETDGKNPLAEDTKAKADENYTLVLKIEQSGENQIFGANTIKVNGKSQAITELGSDSVVSKIKMTALKQDITVSEDSSGIININSSNDMNVTFVMAYYGSDGSLKGVIISEDMPLKKGVNEVNIASIDSDKALSFIMRKSSERVKLMLLDDFRCLKPLRSAYDYKYIYKTYL